MQVAGYVRPQDAGLRVLTLVLELAHQEAEGGEESRMLAAVLLSKLAPTLGPDLTAQFVIPEVINLAEDPGSYKARGRGGAVGGWQGVGAHCALY